MAILRVKSGPQKGKTFEIAGDSQVLGRESSGEVQILDQGISRRHAEIFRIGEMYFIRDLESRNGTFVNDNQIKEELLRIGDQIALGNTVLVFEDRVSRLRDTSGIFSAEAAPDAPVPSPTSTIHLRVTQAIPSARTPDSKQSVEERNLEVLLHLSHIVSEEKDLSRLFSRVAELLGRSLGADHLYLLGLAQDGDIDSPAKIDVDKTFELLGRYHESETSAESAGVSRGIISDCLVNNRSVLTSDASLDQQFNAMESVVMNQLRSVICVPICALGKGIGVIYIYSNRADAFSGDDLELCSAVGIQLGSTIELLKLVRRSDKYFRNSVKALVAATEMRSPDSHGRATRVANYCLAVAKELGMDTQDVRDAWLAGMLYDVGSIPMTEAERENKLTFETKRNHYARELLRGNPGLEHILPALENQNERLDGSGSPEGKTGDTIPPLARLVGLALELDRLLTEGGPDGQDLSIKDSLLKVKEMADHQFDRQTVNAMLIAYRNGKLFLQDDDFFELPTE